MSLPLLWGELEVDWPSFHGGISCLSTKVYHEADFDHAAGDVRKLKTTPTDEELKELYGLYKQATIGDINIGIPISCI
ncbi:Acbd7 [Columba guinea]|nr:Acbd7 [Columba guinea]